MDVAVFLVCLASAIAINTYDFVLPWLSHWMWILIKTFELLNMKYDHMITLKKHMTDADNRMQST